MPLSHPNELTSQVAMGENAPRVLVTGGTSGIGLAIVQGFASRGFEVLAAGVGEMPPDENGITFLPLDVTDDAAITKFVNRYDRLEVLVNAAGAIRRHEELNPDVFQSIIDINLNGTMRMCVACKPLLSLAKGCIINIASMLSYFGGGAVPAYSASKGGVAQLTKSLAIAYAPDGIRVNALAPGWIATPMTSNLRTEDKRNQAIIDRTPLGRWGEPAEMAGPALFLASSQASFITGSLLNVDGGYAAM